MFKTIRWKKKKSKAQAYRSKSKNNDQTSYQPQRRTDADGEALHFVRFLCELTDRQFVLFWYFQFICQIRYFNQNFFRMNVCISIVIRVVVDGITTTNAFLMAIPINAIMWCLATCRTLQLQDNSKWFNTYCIPNSIRLWARRPCHGQGHTSKKMWQRMEMLWYYYSFESFIKAKKSVYHL